jgi:hypothetical protein
MTSASYSADTVQKLTNVNLDEIGFPGNVGATGDTTPNTVELKEGEFITGVYVGAYIRIYGPGPGSGQDRLITAYDGPTQIATVTPVWDVLPAGQYAVIGVSGFTVGGTSSTIFLAGTASNVPGAYVGATIRINSGTGLGQVSIITANSAAFVATVVPTWATAPDATSTYGIYGEGGTATSTATVVQMGAPLSVVEAHYNSLYIEITGCTENQSAVGQTTKIASSLGTQLVLDKPWKKLPIGSFTYLIYGGWGAEYTETAGNQYSMTHISVRAGECGQRHNYGSISSTGLNANGDSLAHRESYPWGVRFDSTSPGLALACTLIPYCYYKHKLVAFSGRIRGGVRVRYVPNAQTANAQMATLAGSSTIAGNGSVGGTGGFPALGQSVMENSLPVVIATDQTVIPVNVQSAGVTITNTNAALDVFLVALGQGTMATSLPVAFATDQSALSVDVRSAGVSITNTAAALDVNVKSGALDVRSAGVLITNTAAALDVNVKSGAFGETTGLSVLYVETVGNTGLMVTTVTGVAKRVIIANDDPVNTSYVKLYDQGTVPDENDVPKNVIPVYAQTSRTYDIGVKYLNGIGIRATGGISNTDTTAPGSLVVNVVYTA